MYIQSQPTIMISCGGMSERDESKAMELTEQDNEFLDRFRGKYE